VPCTWAFFSSNNHPNRINPKSPKVRRSSYLPNHSTNKPTKTRILSKQQAYLLLLGSIAVECTGASLSKRSRDIGSLALFAVACALNMTSMFGLNVVLSRIAVGTAYAAWGAIGTILVTTVGVVIFQEPWSLLKGLYLTMIATGVIGLNLSHS
jgi:multidrug transporter EmrE-like cation transporter